MEKANSRQRELKNRIRISSSVDKKLYDVFEEIANETKIPKSKLYDMALELLAQKYNKNI
ncbi:Ribbon-helix-helix domain [uncultured Clostridium sp.]|nr:Ribbon-helix-helix domain [uncultured Clostridium sp.]